MPGRLRTASRPSSTVIDSAPYSCFFCAATLGHFLAPAAPAGRRRARVRRTGRDVGARDRRRRPSGQRAERAGRRGCPRIAIGSDTDVETDLGPPARVARPHRVFVSLSILLCAEDRTTHSGTLARRAEKCRSRPNPRSPTTPPTRRGRSPIATRRARTGLTRAGAASGVARATACRAVRLRRRREPAVIVPVGSRTIARPIDRTRAHEEVTRWGWTTSRCTGRGPAGSTTRSRRPSSSTSASSPTLPRHRRADGGAGRATSPRPARSGRPRTPSWSTCCSASTVCCTPPTPPPRTRTR